MHSKRPPRGPEILPFPRPADEPARAGCPACAGPLGLHQPDPQCPDLLLGICGSCRRWYAILAGRVGPELAVPRDREGPGAARAGTPVGPGGGDDGLGALLEAEFARATRLGDVSRGNALAARRAIERSREISLAGAVSTPPDPTEADPMSEQELMRLAIERARAGIAAGQSPFGSVIARGGEVVAATHNTVWRDTDPTAHAEVNCLRAAAAALATIDLKGSTLYSTCEPCPMCLAAIHWAKVDRVVYGATIEDAAAAGFAELRVAARALAEMGGSPLVVEPGPLREECAGLFSEWKRAGLAGAY